MTNLEMTAKLTAALPAEDLGPFIIARCTQS